MVMLKFIIYYKLTIHLQDLLALHKTNPEVYEEFLKGHFILHKSRKMFSGVALDQAHEHNHAIVKADC